VAGSDPAGRVPAARASLSGVAGRGGRLRGRGL